MRKTLLAALIAAALAVGTAVGLSGQAVSVGGAFLPLQDYVLGGTWEWQNATPWVLEGATVDGNELRFAVNDPTADVTVTFPDGGNTSYAIVPNTLTTNEVDVANSVWFTSNDITFEGATADASELTLTLNDPGGDVTVTMPDGGDASWAMVPNLLTTNEVDIANSIWFTSNDMTLEGATADGFEAVVTLVDPTADRTLTLPDQTGTVQLVDNMVGAGGTLTLTAALHTGATILFDTAGGSVVTLPAATATGDCYNFVVSVTVTSNVHSIVVADATDEFVGHINMAEDGANPGLVFSAADAGDNDNVDMNGSTTGGDIGDTLRVCDILTDNWSIEGTVNGTGTEASPFVTGQVS